MSAFPYDPTKLAHKSMTLALALLLWLAGGPAFAEEEIDLGRASQEFANPISKFTLWIMENDVVFLDGDVTDNTKVTDVFVIEPVIPVPLGDSGWTLVNRPIIPIGFSADIPIAGLSGNADAGFDITTDTQNDNGLGDITFFSLLSPQAKGSLLWGVGPTMRFPTATDNDLGSEKLSVGPAAIALFSSRKFTLGFLNQNFFSIAGESSRRTVRSSTLQYFAFYNFTPEWGVGTAPIISFNWRAGNDDKVALPIGLGVTRTFRIGKVPARLLVEGQYYAVQRDAFSPEWNIRVALGLFLPNITTWF